jgi:hypothetical protein
VFGRQGSRAPWEVCSPCRLPPPYSPLRLPFDANRRHDPFRRITRIRSQASLERTPTSKDRVRAGPTGAGGPGTADVENVAEIRRPDRIVTFSRGHRTGQPFPVAALIAEPAKQVTSRAPSPQHGPPRRASGDRSDFWWRRRECSTRPRPAPAANSAAHPGDDL